MRLGPYPCPAPDRWLYRITAFDTLVGVVTPAAGIAELGRHFGHRRIALNTLVGVVAPAAGVAEFRRYLGERLAALDALGGLVGPATGIAKLRFNCHGEIIVAVEDQIERL